MTAAALVLALQLGAWTAPWLHAHLDEHEAGHHHGRLIHAHASTHTVAQPAGQLPSRESTAGRPHVHHPDDDAERPVALQVFVAVQPRPVTTPAIAGEVFELPAPSLRPAAATVPITGGHDPPAVGSLPSRAPPLPAQS